MQLDAFIYGCKTEFTNYGSVSFVSVSFVLSWKCLKFMRYSVFLKMSIIFELIVTISETNEQRWATQNHVDDADHFRKKENHRMVGHPFSSNDLVFGDNSLDLFSSIWTAIYKSEKV